MTTRWTAEMLAGVARQDGAALPPLPREAGRVAPGLDLWDMWPLADAEGSTVMRGGRTLWFFLAAPRGPDPEQRHAVARIHTLTHGADGWRHHGPTLPDGWSPGSREWSGSAVWRDGHVALHFTAAGRRGAPFDYEQRLFAATARLDWTSDTPAFAWSEPVETIVADGRRYCRADQRAPVDGRIKGFRDPAWFRDPADGAAYLTFTGSTGRQAFDGVIGLARQDGDRWTPLSPLVDATGVASELERPHLIVRDGLYYLFWSVPARSFAAGTGGVTGLYAMTAPALAGPWTPVNGTGLVAANPAADPHQAYCWWVTGELDVASFVDLPGTAGGGPPRFGGIPAPFFRLAIDGSRIAIVGAAALA